MNRAKSLSLVGLLSLLLIACSGSANSAQPKAINDTLDEAAQSSRNYLTSSGGSLTINGNTAELFKQTYQLQDNLLSFNNSSGSKQVFGYLNRASSLIMISNWPQKTFAVQQKAVTNAQNLSYYSLLDNHIWLLTIQQNNFSLCLDGCSNVSLSGQIKRSSLPGLRYELEFSIPNNRFQLHNMVFFNNGSHGIMADLIDTASDNALNTLIFVSLEDLSFGFSQQKAYQTRDYEELIPGYIQDTLEFNGQSYSLSETFNGQLINDKNISNTQPFYLTNGLIISTNAGFNKQIFANGSNCGPDLTETVDLPIFGNLSCDYGLQLHNPQSDYAANIAYALATPQFVFTSDNNLFFPLSAE